LKVFFGKLNPVVFTENSPEVIGELSVISVGLKRDGGRRHRREPR
jgi:hypothetical protein